MRYGFLTINNGRLHILKLWCAGIRRLRGVFDEFPVVCVGGEDEAAICDHYGIHHITQANSPASEKWNTGARWLGEQETDYIIISGSDDIFSTDTVARMINAMEGDPDLIGFMNLYVYGTVGKFKGHLRIITTKSIMGVGKTVHRRIFEVTNWKPWEYWIKNPQGVMELGRSWGMDAIFTRNTAQYIKSRVILDNVVVVDVKSDQSLNKYTVFERNRHGTTIDPNIFLNILGEEERILLANIQGSPVGLETFLKNRM